ncbi:restriction endonuclease subunit S [[Clostridium] symbiosum]|uniref:restriction endonuclease subunit S n=1 Tax=Clostridium symbiosum TaxID=1512 RepID=UPI000823576F|nr:restriction endonuclease subunit S [[Clostridium] symbiosum]SCJ27826.1 EcoKI restriction-modification system protein HsdS [uncultured Clostridium sp.]
MLFAKLNDLSIGGKGSYGIAASAVERKADLPTYLRITDIFDDGTLNLSELKSVDAPNSDKYILKPNDIVFARTGGSTGRNYFYDGSDGVFVYAGFLIKFSIDPEKVNPKYVKYYCRSKQYNDWVQSFNTGSTRGNINAQIFGNMEIPLPERKQQDYLVSILEPIDEKIRNNKQVNDNLADLLQTIYQERFGNDILAVNQGVLSDICSYSRDKVAVSELNVRTYFSTENMLSGKAGSTEATSLPTTSQTTACHKGDTLISNIRPYFKKIVYCEDKCGCSTDVLCFTPSQPCYSAYLFSTLYADKFFAFMVAGSKGTKMPRGDKQQIMTYPVVLPSEEELAGFNTIASPLLEQIYSNRAENKRLSILRDTLLPKLMSGEIDVSAVQL